MLIAPSYLSAEAAQYPDHFRMPIIIAVAIAAMIAAVILKSRPLEVRGNYWSGSAADQNSSRRPRACGDGSQFLRRPQDRGHHRRPVSPSDAWNDSSWRREGIE